MKINVFGKSISVLITVENEILAQQRADAKRTLAFASHNYGSSQMIPLIKAARVLNFIADSCEDRNAVRKITSLKAANAWVRKAFVFDVENNGHIV